MTNMHVLQVNKFYYPQIGGVEEVARAIAEGISERGHESSVLASVPSGRGSHDEIRGVSVVRTGSVGVAMSVPLTPSFPIRLWQLSRDADIVHHHLPNPLSAAASHLTPPSGAKTVVTYHSDIVRQSRALKLYRPLLHSFLDDVDHIFVTSPRLLESSDHLEPYTEKCSVVPLSIDLDHYNPDSELEFDVPTRSDRPTILFAGRLNYYKGVEHLVDAMESVDATLLIAGDGRRREELEKRVHDAGLEGKIEFLGRISDEKLHYCYDVADLFVLPSVERSEAFGIVQLEAMAYETPVINTNLPTGVPWVSKDGETGLTVPPQDSKALADAITTLLSNDTLRAELGANARERVEDQFDRKSMVTAVERTYQELLSS